SVVGTQIAHAAGIAYAAKLRGLDEVAVTCIGEGGTSQGDWHEGLNWAGVHRLAFVCIVQDNDYAISVPHRLQMGVDNVAKRDEGLLAEEEDDRIQQECTADVDEAVVYAEAAASPAPEDALRNVFAEG